MPAPQQEARAREIVQSCNIYSDYAEKVFAQALARERAEGAREERELAWPLIEAAFQVADGELGNRVHLLDVIDEAVEAYRAALRARDATPLTVGQDATP